MSFGKNYSIFSDLDELDKMVRGLDSYLNSGDIYGNIGGGFFTGGTAPKLTIGAILMRLRRLHVLANHLTDSQRSQLQTLASQHNEIRTNRSEAYTDKMEHEANSRLDAMRQFFEECRRDPGACGGIYNPELLRRTIVQEILMEMEASGISSEDLDKKVTQTDAQLRRLIRVDDFQWDPTLEPVYPKKDFWWLYMSPQG